MNETKEQYKQRLIEEIERLINGDKRGEITAATILHLLETGEL
jgi:hypothetical protein